MLRASGRGQKATSLEMEVLLRSCSAQQAILELGLDVYSPDLVYLCNLAESMRLLRALGVLEEVWKVAKKDNFGEDAFSKSLQAGFLEARAKPDFTPLSSLKSEIGSADFLVFDKISGAVVAGMPEKEIFWALWLVSFLVDLDIDFIPVKAHLKEVYLEKLLED